jgi:ubiquitin-conjugating enzyme E2 J2
MQNLPNMGEKERGKSDDTSATSVSVKATGTVTPGPRLTSTFMIPAPVQAPHASTTLNGDPSLPKPPTVGVNGRGVLGTWAAGWRTMIWEKWRWGALIALAVVVSRLSS